MDVTLERVQFKFASIIGELCSKPVILSQFAIWVDLRLAEYKLKGAISLDCSGDKPDPDWLKGMKDSDESSPDYPGSEHHRSPARGRSINHNRSFGETTDGSHIKEIDIPNRVVAESEFGDSATIVIKNDSDDERQGVFPTGLHVHESRNYNHRRKRSRESGLDIGEDGLYTVMHPKMLKSSEPSMLSQSSNQSLMSIIGGQDSVIEASPVSLEDSQRDIDLGMAIQLQESQHMGDNSSFIAGRPSSHATSTITQSSQEADISFNSPQSKSSMVYTDVAVDDSVSGTFIKTEPPYENEGFVNNSEVEGSRPAMHTIKQEPEDDGAYEHCWNTTPIEQTLSCKSEPENDDAKCLNEEYGTDHRITGSPASFWLQSMVNRSEGKRSLGSASQTLLSLLEKGRESVVKAGCESTTAINNIAGQPSSYSTTPSGLTLAALLTRTEKYTPSAPTSAPCHSSPKVSPGGYKGSPLSGAEGDSIYNEHNEHRGLTRLRRLLQGEDITVPPLEPFKKKCDNLESARAALKYYIARHRLETHSNPADCESSSEFDQGDSNVDLHLKCIFCNYVRTIDDDSNFILHVFAHANKRELEKFQAGCPRCSISDLPITEFVCHSLSHCVVSAPKPCS